RWLILDADASFSRARFTQYDAIGQYVPEAIGTVYSAGVTLEGTSRFSASLRWRYFGPRALIEDNAARSKATSLWNIEQTVRLTPTFRLTGEVLNLLNNAASDVDYFYTSRLPGEPAGGISDFHFHPSIPRTARISLTFNLR